MKFMIEAVMLKNAMQLLAYDYVLMVAGSRNYGDPLAGHAFEKTNSQNCARSLNLAKQA